MPLWINPAQAQESEQFILGQYIRQNPHLGFIQKNKKSSEPYHIFTDQSFKKEFYLLKSILRRKRKKEKWVRDFNYRYEVVGDEMIGAGSIGNIYPSLATLKLSESHLKPTNKLKKRIIKIQNEVNEQGESELVSQWVQHLGGKVRTLHNGQSYTVMKRMPGKNLQEIFNEKKLTIEEKLHLLLALFKTWKKQVADNGLVHRDIKPENIMVHFIPGSCIPQINIIDYGFAKIKEEDDSGECLGTPIYIAPELLEGRGSSLASDIYSLGKIFRKMFSENHSSLNEHEEIYLDYLKNELTKENFKFSKLQIEFLDSLGTNNCNLFKEDAGLSIFHQRRLKKLMQKMDCYFPSERPPIEQVIDELNLICQERKHIAKLLTKLNYLKNLYPVYQILSSYSQLFAINKISIESDEKKINCYLKLLFSRSADLDLIEKEVDQIMKSWDNIKKNNESPAFISIFAILNQCLAVHEDKLTQNELEIKIKRKVVSYLKTHMRDLITNQDIYAVKRLKAISNFLNDLIKNPVLDKKVQIALDKKISIILSKQYNKNLLHSAKIAEDDRRNIPTIFFKKPCVSRVKALILNNFAGNGLEYLASKLESNISL